MSSKIKQFPYYEISGSYEQIGEFLGITFRKEIQECIKRRKVEIKEYDSFLPKSNECLEYTQKYFPNLILETKAEAKAAGVNLLDLFFVNNREAFDPAEEYDRKDAVVQDHCTGVVCFNNGDVIVGHNEDWSIEAIDELFILKVAMKDVSFIGLNYNVATLGLSASMNSFGLVQGINDLHQINNVGVPKNYIARAILEAKSLDEAEKIIRSVPRASGFNHLLVQNNEIRNIEIAGNEVGIQKIINKPYVHTNHYLTPELINFEAFHSKSSEERYKRASELLKDNMNIDDVKALLSDKKNKEFPISRDNETIGSAVFIPNQLQAYFCYGAPTLDNYIKYDL